MSGKSIEMKAKPAFLGDLLEGFADDADPDGARDL